MASIRPNSPQPFTYTIFNEDLYYVRRWMSAAPGEREDERQVDVCSGQHGPDILEWGSPCQIRRNIKTRVINEQS